MPSLSRFSHEFTFAPESQPNISSSAKIFLPGETEAGSAVDATD